MHDTYRGFNGHIKTGLDYRLDPNLVAVGNKSAPNMGGLGEISSRADESNLGFGGIG